VPAGNDPLPVTGHPSRGTRAALPILGVLTALVGVRLSLWPLTSPTGPVDVEGAAAGFALTAITVAVAIVLARSGMPPIHGWAMLAVAAAWAAAGLESIEFAGTLLPYLGNICADLIALAGNAFFLRWPLPSLTRRLRCWLFSAFGVLVAIGVLDTYTFPAWRIHYDPWDFQFLELTVPPEFHGHVVVPLHTGSLVTIETVTLVIIWRRMRRFTGPARIGQAVVVAAFGANYLLDVVVNGTRIPTLWDGPWAPSWPVWFPFLGALDNLVTFVLVLSPLVDLLLRRTAAAVVVDEVVPRAAAGPGEPLDRAVHRALGDMTARVFPPGAAATGSMSVHALVDGRGGILGHLAFTPGAGYTGDERHMRATTNAVRLGLATARRRVEREELVLRLADARAEAVEAGLAERRVIERNLHDGVQQALLGLSAVLARADLAREEGERRRVVIEARERAAEVRQMLVSVTVGLRPPGLARGLAGALPALAAGGTLDVRLHMPEEEGVHLPAAVENAAYYVVAEALSNAVKHADATKVDIRVERVEEDLVVSVADDGRGGAELRPDGGLVGLKDRVASAGGSFSVTSTPGSGSTVRAVFASVP
jgi:signal transduction histidine kinase